MVWGTGTPRREFLYVDDMADACVHLMKTYSGDELVNIGTGEDITIAEFARVVAATVGYTGEISFDASRPDGTPRKLLDVSRLAKTGLARPHLARGRHPAGLSGVSERIEMIARRGGLQFITLVRRAPTKVRFVQENQSSAVALFHMGLPSRSEGSARGGIMKFPRRQFLHLAAGAALLPAVSRTARAQSYPTRPDPPDHRLYPRRLGGPDRATDGAMAFGTARSVIRHREPARRRHQHRHRGGPAGRA